jgi:hypothetical protein
MSIITHCNTILYQKTIAVLKGKSAAEVSGLNEESFRSP